MITITIIAISLIAIFAAIFSKKRSSKKTDSSEEDLSIGVETSVPEEKVIESSSKKPQTFLSKKFLQEHGLPE